MKPSLESCLAELLVHHSLEAAAGHRIGVLAAGQSPLTEALAWSIRRAGSVPLTWHELTAAAEVDSLAVIECFPPLLRQRDGLFAPPRLVERVRHGSMRWVVSLTPTAAFRDAFRAACFLDRPEPAAEWRRQAAKQAAIIARLGVGRRLRIQAPPATDLTLSVAGQTWINAAGQSNMPDGEVFTAPVPGSAAGVATLALPGGVGRVQLRIDGGRIVQCRADDPSFNGAAWFGIDAGAAEVAEVGFGCNSAVTAAAGHPLIDEKRLGTFHLGFGMGYTAAGGGIRSAVHWDLVGEINAGGAVWIDDRILMADGRFLTE
jgi:leucyl aminopeptidase (aminopeptidase T)